MRPTRRFSGTGQPASPASAAPHPAPRHRPPVPQPAPQPVLHTAPRLRLNGKVAAPAPSWATGPRPIALESRPGPPPRLEHAPAPALPKPSLDVLAQTLKLSELDFDFAPAEPVKQRLAAPPVSVVQQPAVQQVEQRHLAQSSAVQTVVQQELRLEDLRHLRPDTVSLPRPAGKVQVSQEKLLLQSAQIFVEPSDCAGAGPRGGHEGPAGLLCHHLSRRPPAHRDNGQHDR